MSCDDPFPEIGLEVNGKLFEDSEEDLTGEDFLEKGEESCHQGQSFKQFARIGDNGVTEIFAVLSSEGRPM
jgi:hypothetical protein